MIAMIGLCLVATQAKAEGFDNEDVPFPAGTVLRLKQPIGVVLGSNVWTSAAPGSTKENPRACNLIFRQANLAALPKATGKTGATVSKVPASSAKVKAALPPYQVDGNWISQVELEDAGDGTTGFAKIYCIWDKKLSGDEILVALKNYFEVTPQGTAQTHIEMAQPNGQSLSPKRMHNEGQYI